MAPVHVATIEVSVIELRVTIGIVGGGGSVCTLMEELVGPVPFLAITATE